MKYQKVKMMIAKMNKTMWIYLFLAKKIEDCSEKSLKYYGATINAMINDINKKIKNIKTDDIRTYLTEYQSKKNSNRVKIDNISRILFSFILRLEDDC